MSSSDHPNADHNSLTARQRIDLRIWRDERLPKLLEAITASGSQKALAAYLSVSLSVITEARRGWVSKSTTLALLTALEAQDRVPESLQSRVDGLRDQLAQRALELGIKRPSPGTKRAKRKTGRR